MGVGHLSAERSCHVQRNNWKIEIKLGTGCETKDICLKVAEGYLLSFPFVWRKLKVAEAVERMGGTKKGSGTNKTARKELGY